MTSQTSQPSRQSNFDLSLSRRYFVERVFQIACWTSVAIGLTVLAVLLIDVFLDGLPRLDWTLLTNFPSRKPDQAGLKSALVGTIWVMAITAIVTFPLGVGAGIYLEEFARESWFAKFIQVNISNLAAVPSIIYGLLGVTVFVRLIEPISGGRTVLAGGLTLSLLVLPIVIVSTREALGSVPDSLRQAGFALGATRWQVVREQVFPLAFPGILTGTILALSRAIGETAPLIAIGALTFIAFLPPLENPIEGLRTPFTVMPIQIFNWVSRPQPAFHTVAAAGIVVLMVVLLLMNATAIWLRNRFQRNFR